MTNGENRFDSAFEGAEGENPQEQEKSKQSVDPRKKLASLIFRLIDELVGETNIDTQRKLLGDVLDMVESADRRKLLTFKVLSDLLSRFPAQQMPNFGERHKRLAHVLKIRSSKFTARRVDELLGRVIEEKDFEKERLLLVPVLDLIEGAWREHNLRTSVLESFFEKFPDRQRKTFESRVRKLDDELFRRKQWEAEQDLLKREAAKSAPVVHGGPSKDVETEESVGESGVGGDDNVVDLPQTEPSRPATPEEVAALERAAGVAPEEVKKRKGFFRI